MPSQHYVTSYLFVSFLLTSLRPTGRFLLLTKTHRNLFSVPFGAIALLPSNSKVTYHLRATRNRNLLVSDTHYRPALGAAFRERIKCIGQLFKVDHARDLVQVPRTEVALRELSPQLAPCLGLGPVGVYAQEAPHPLG